MPLPQCEFVGTRTVRDIEFAVERSPEGVLIGHCWAREQVSGQSYILIEQGFSLDELDAGMAAMMDASEEHAREADEVAHPHLVGEGWDSTRPPPARLPR